MAPKAKSGKNLYPTNAKGALHPDYIWP